MRAEVVYHLLSGQAWLSAGVMLLLLIAAELAGWPATRPVLRAVARIGYLLAIGVAGLSGTPVPLWLLILLVLSLGAVIATGFRSERSRAGRIASAAALAIVLASIAVESRWHRPPRIEPPAGATWVIVGDSLSSGGFGEAAPWPSRFASLAGVSVRNLALPGETVRSAMKYQIPRIAAIGRPTVLVIELGGNDLLGETPRERYAADLDEMLAQARRASPASIVMFELPLPPGRWRWGAIQRRLATKHGVVLIPKRVIARILSTPGFVDDGLHPTDEGHARLASEVTRLIRTDT